MNYNISQNWNLLREGQLKVSLSIPITAYAMAQ